MIIHSIHGFNVSDEGAATIDKLTPLLQETGRHLVQEHNYPEFFRLRVRLCNKAMAMLIRDMVKPGDSVVAHSNGCAIVYLAAKAGAQFENVTLINPALDSKLAIPHAGSVDVWHSDSDPWTSLARFIPWSIWGAQGRTGYTGDDARYKNYNEDEIFNEKVGHSGMFSDIEKRRAIVSTMFKRIN